MTWGQESEASELARLRRERDECIGALFSVVGFYPYSVPADRTVGECRKVLDKYKHHLGFQELERIRLKVESNMRIQRNMSRVDL